MTIGANPTAEARSITLQPQLESLSGVFGELAADERLGHLVTNDKGLPALLPTLKERVREAETDGIGFFIGAGGVFSLLSELEIETPVVVDRNASVLDFSEALGAVIADKADDFSQLSGQAAVCFEAVAELSEQRSEIVKRMIAKDGALTWVADKLIAEARRYGTAHWSNPDKVTATAEAIQAHPPTYIAANVQNTGFAKAFSAISGNHGQQITFANLTNIHEWVARAQMDFMRALPFAPDATILFSSAGSRKPLEMEVACSLDEYIERTKPVEVY